MIRPQAHILSRHINADNLRLGAAVLAKLLGVHRPTVPGRDGDFRHHGGLIRDSHGVCWTKVSGGHWMPLPDTFYYRSHDSTSLRVLLQELEHLPASPGHTPPHLPGLLLRAERVSEVAGQRRQGEGGHGDCEEGCFIKQLTNHKNRRNPNTDVSRNLCEIRRAQAELLLTVPKVLTLEDLLLLHHVADHRHRVLRLQPVHQPNQS